MNEKIILLRKPYFIMISFFIFFMYPLRLYFLEKEPYLYSFRKHFFVPYKEYSFENIPLMFIILGIICMYLFGFLIPKKMKVTTQCKYINQIKIIFIIQFFLLMFSSIILENKSGGKVTTILYFFNILIDSLLGREFLFVIILYYQLINKKKNKIYLILYIIPSFFLGSKSGIIFVIFYYVWLKLIFKEKIFTKKIFFSIVTLYILYPTIWSFSWIVRSGKFNFNRIIFFNTHNILEPLKLLSHRISGIDVFMAKYEGILDINKLSTYENILYFFKGIFTNKIFNYISLNKQSYGRVFAEQVFHQPKYLISAYESTLLGTVYYSKDRLFFSILLIIILLTSLKIIKKLSTKRKEGFFIFFFLTQLNIFILFGTLAKIGTIFRYYFILSFFILLLKNIGEKNEK